MQPTKLFSILSILAGSQVFAKDGEESSTSVITGSKSNFESLIKSEEPVLVEFFAPWCGHCKKLAPEYETAAGELKKNNIKLASVDCTVETEICNTRAIKEFPTLAVFKSGSEITRYKGPRESGAIVKFMKKQASPAVTVFDNPDQLKKFVDSDDFVVVGFFKNPEGESAKTFKAVAENMRSDFLFAIMTEPTGTSYKDGQIVVYRNFDEKEVVMKEKVGIESLSHFVTAESFPLTAEIGPDNYSRYFDSGFPMAYFFYADEKQKEQYESAVITAAKAVKGKVLVVFINGALYGQHAESLNLPQEWPAFAVHEVKSDFKYPLAKGVSLTADSLKKHLVAFTEGKLKPNFKSEPIPKDEDSSNEPVRTLVHDNFDAVAFDKSKDVLVEIFAPWCGACKRIAPEYTELAKNIASSTGGDKFILAKFDGTANDIPASLNFRLEHYPTFKLIKSGSNEVISYEDDLSYNDLLRFLKKNAGNKLDLAEKEVSAPPVKPDQQDSDDAEDDHLDL